MWKATFVLTFVLSGAVHAACPAAPDHSETFASLVADIRAAKNELAAQPISNRMWELWTDAPDAQSQEVLDRGMRMRSSYNFTGALQEFDLLVEYCPDYAEGYNQRAFVNYLSGDYATAVPDLERALELSPKHIAARAGLALTLMQLGDLAQARTELRRALEDNPWLSERHLMDKGGPLAPKGDDI